MAMIQFVQNYEDLSTDMGFQFKFHCDKCRNGFMSHFQGSAIGMAGSALRAASDLFGGFLGNASRSAFDVQRTVGGKAHDDALEAAVQEGKQFFKQCGRCARWVCPEVCWNPEASQCTECAPKYDQEFAAHHAQAKASAAAQQLNQKAQETDYVAGTDMSAGVVAAAAAPAMQAPPPPAMPAAPAPQQLGGGAACGKCGTGLGAFKFCPNCGTPRAQATACKCGAQLVPGMKFCGECGTPHG
jgi:zinc-ribbon domain